MKRFLPVILLTLALAGCAQLGQVVTTATTTIVNPISAVDIYRAKTIYAASLQAAVEWRRLCWSKPFANIVGDAKLGIPADPILKPLCQHRRQWLRAIQSAQAKAGSALGSATIFVQDNPTLNASSVIAAAMAAVTDFRNAIPAQN